MQPKNAERFCLISEWDLPAPPEAVWSLLSEPTDWPRWWPQVRRVDRHAAGDAEGVDAVYRTSWGSRLPYQMNIESRVLRAERPRLIEVEAQGDVLGRGEWRLSPWGGGTRVRYCWEVRLARPWMRRLATLLHPVFAWNHHQVMAAGAAGMAKALGTGPPEYRPAPDSPMPPMPPAPSDPPAAQSQPEEPST